MKVKIEIDTGLAETEIIIRCNRLDDSIVNLQSTIMEQGDGRQCISLNKGETAYYVPMEEIYFFETEGGVIRAHTADKLFEAPYKLYELEEMLPAGFMRVSKSTIVNLDYIYSITRNLTASSVVEFVGILVDGVLNRSYGMILFPLAFLVIVNDELLGLEAITPWPVLGAALLGTIGFNILFPGKRRKHMEVICETGLLRNGENGDTEDVLSGEEISFSNSFGESVKYLTGSEISFLNLSNSFGSLEVYFNNAVLKNGVAEVNANNSFGSIALYVPGDWRVLTNVNCFFGDESEKGRCNPQNDNTLYVNGSVSFGNLEIRYL